MFSACGLGGGWAVDIRCDRWIARNAADSGLRLDAGRAAASGGCATATRPDNSDQPQGLIQSNQTRPAPGYSKSGLVRRFRRCGARLVGQPGERGELGFAVSVKPAAPAMLHADNHGRCYGMHAPCRRKMSDAPRRAGRGWLRNRDAAERTVSGSSGSLS
jgi:hypothetical protein